MKILVCISHVPDTTSKINFSENNTVFDKTGVQFVINPNDEFGLTRAIWFKEKIMLLSMSSMLVFQIQSQHLEKHLRLVQTKQ